MVSEELIGEVGSSRRRSRSPDRHLLFRWDWTTVTTLAAEKFVYPQFVLQSSTPFSGSGTGVLYVFAFPPTTSVPLV
jgi:hypothetical protein